MSIKQIVLRTFVLGAIAASATMAAKAETLDFTLTGQGTDITFDLSSTPAVSTHTYESFTLDNVVLDVNGHNITTNLVFYTSGDDGGFAAETGSHNELFDLGYAQLFSGSTSHPTFAPGDFTLTPLGDVDSFAYCGGHDTYNLSIVDPSAVTPEPSSMLLMATGILALVGAGVSKRFAA